MPFVNDSFTDTNGVLLQNHTGEVGATWTRHTSYTVNSEIQANRAEASGNTSAYHASGTPATAEYDVSATVNFDLGGSDILAGVTGRMSTSVNTFYWAVHQSNGANQWVLYKVEAGSFISLGTWAENPGTGATRRVKLEIRTAAKKLYVATVERISSADDAITAAGLAGLRFQGPDNLNKSLEDFDASDVAGATGNPGWRTLLGVGR